MLASDVCPVINKKELIKSERNVSHLIFKVKRYKFLIDLQKLKLLLYLL